MDAIDLCTRCASMSWWNSAISWDCRRFFLQINRQFTNWQSVITDKRLKLKCGEMKTNEKRNYRSINRNCNQMMSKEFSVICRIFLRIVSDCKRVSNFTAMIWTPFSIALIMGTLIQLQENLLFCVFELWEQVCPLW